jgi:trimeric autotransporter adhesin
MNQETIYALLAAAAYEDARFFALNRSPIPPGWRQLSEFDVSGSGSNASWTGSGFTGRVFQGPGGQIVIAYAGTEFRLDQAGGVTDFISGNVPLAAGLYGEQGYQAALLYQRVQARFGASADIAFTGHSLGGGLAGLMGVWFDRPAIVFDPAPFEASADHSRPAATSTRQQLADAGYRDPKFDNYRYTTDFSTREARVASYAISGEVLEQIPLLRIEHNRVSYLTGAAPQLSPGDKHSIDLLGALMMVDGFKGAATALPELLPAMFNAQLYGHPVLETQQNFLMHLIRNEVGVIDPRTGVQITPPNGLLTKFTADVQQLVQVDSGRTQSQLRTALVAAAMDYYALREPATATALISTNANAVHLDLTTINPDLNQLKSPRLLAEASWSLSADAGNFAQITALTAQTWHVQTGSGAMSWTAADGKHAAALGGAQADSLTGGAGNDLLVGLAGNDNLTGGDGGDVLDGGLGADTLVGGNGLDMLFAGAGADSLEGGAGNDRLDGGADFDTYRFAAAGGSFGNDIVIDAGGQGQLVVDGIGTLTANGAIRTGDNTWKSPDDKVRFTRVAIDASRTDLVITVQDTAAGGAQGSITVQRWTNNQLGITLAGTVQPPAVHTLTAGNDYRGRNGGSAALPGDSLIIQADLGHDVVSVGLTESDTRAFTVYGAAGNDMLFGAAGNDQLEGGDGNDLLSGNRGADLIMGGAGNDIVMPDISYMAIGPLRSGSEPTPSPTRAEIWAQEGAAWGWQFNSDGTTLVPGQRIRYLEDTDLLSTSMLFADGGHELVMQNIQRDDDIGDTVFAGAGDDVVYGGRGSDLLNGEGDNDVLLGGGGDDSLTGGAGVDELSGSDGADWLDGGNGDDKLHGGYGADSIGGGDGNDDIEGDLSIFGNTGQLPAATQLALIGNDRIDGGTGNDSINGGGGGDTLYGGQGTDTIWGDVARDGVNRPGTYDGRDYIDGGDDSDVLEGGGGDDTLIGGWGNDRALGDGSAARLNGTVAGNDHLDGGLGNDTLAGDAGNDTLIGGLDQDVLLGDNAHSQTPSADHGRDWLDGGDGNDSIHGGGNADWLIGGKGNDTLFGDAPTVVEVEASTHGDDFIDGGVGTDGLVGGGGNDTLLGGDGADTLDGDYDDARLPTQHHGNDRLDGGNDNDSLNGRGGNDTLLGGVGVDTLFGGVGHDMLWGEDGNDQLRGDGGDDYLNGGAGADGVVGGFGNDTLTTSDSDLLDGGYGNDVYELSLQPSIEVNGQLTVVSPMISDSGGANLIRAGWVAAEDCHVFTQDGHVRLAVGNLGVITLGLNTPLTGLAIEVSDGASVTLQYLVERDDPNDETRAGFWTTNGLVWDTRATAPMTLDGTSGNDRLFGARWNDTVNGNGGKDTLLGMGGNDVLRANDVPGSRNFGGDDLLAGGDGNDSLEGGTDNDTLFGEAGNDYLHGDTALADQFVSGSDYLNGGLGNDTLMGHIGNDTLDGGAGSDTLDGGMGIDTFFFGRGSGTDFVVYGDHNRGETDDLLMAEDLTPDDVTLQRRGDDLLLRIRGTEDLLHVEGFFVDEYTWLTNFDACGTLFRQVVFADGTIWNLGDIKARTAQTTAGDDSLASYRTGDRLYTIGQTLLGGEGDDGLYGRDGADALDGGAGSDGLRGDAANDTLLGRAGNDGLDGGDGHDLLLGGEDNDNLTGGDGSDTLDGGGGYYHGRISTDHLYGGAGNDVYLFDRGSGSDFVRDSGNAGSSFDTIRLGENVRPQDVTLLRIGIPEYGTTSNTSLLLRINGTDDELRVDRQFDNLYLQSSIEDRIERVEFSDGTVWDFAMIAAVASQTGDGDDTVYGNPWLTHLDGGLGNDLMYSEGATTTLNGGGGRDTLRAVAGGSDLRGDGGADSLVGGAGNDTLDGGTGADTLSGDPYGSGSRGADTFRFGRGSGRDVLEGQGYDPELALLDDTVEIGPGVLPSDLILSRSPYEFPGNLQVGGLPSDLMIAIRGTTDRLLVQGYFPRSGAAPGFAAIRFDNGEVWNAAVVQAQLAASAIPIGTTVQGYSGNDTLVGLAGADTLSAGDGNDWLDGGAGDDLLQAGIGNDVFVFNRGSGYDTVADAERSDEVRFGSGIAVADLVFTRESDDLVVTLVNSSDALRIDGYWALDTAKRVDRLVLADGTVISPQQAAALLVDTGEGVVRYATGAGALNGSTGADQLNDSAGNDVLSGGVGADYLSAAAGQDTLNGGTQNDTLFGGAGADALGGGADDDSLHGDEGNDTLDGGAGDDTLDGGAGSDTYLFGIGSGHDVIDNVDVDAGSVDGIHIGAGISPTDVLVVLQDDTLLLQVRGRSDSLLLRGHANNEPASRRIDRVIFADGTVWTEADLYQRALTGTAASDLLTADMTTSIADTINALGGDDIVWTGKGNDFVDAGSGEDSVYGGEGDDTLHGGAQDDWLNSQQGNDTLLGGSGNDTLEAGDGDDMLMGGDGDDHLSGDYDMHATLVLPVGRDTLDGGAGNDTLSGGAGDDVYLFGRGDGRDVISDTVAQTPELDVLEFKAGVAPSDIIAVRRFDPEAYSGAGRYWLELQIANTSDVIAVEGIYHPYTGDVLNQTSIQSVRFADGTIWDAATVGSMATRIVIAGSAISETLTGTAAAEFMVGLAGNDTLLGAGGGDWLDGGFGADQMEGGTGDDTYVVDSIADQTIEAAEGGSDLIMSSVSWTLVTETESLRLTGTAAIDGIGNAAINVLTGNSANNVLDGGAGVDTMRGGYGDDTYLVDNASDVAEESENAGRDTVASSVTWTLSDEFENLNLTGSAAINGTGNGVNNNIAGNGASNVLSGGLGDDRLDGGAGADTLIGGAGNDTLAVDNVGDSVVETSNGGTDTVESSISWVLAIDLERLVLTGSNAIDGTGNSVANTLTGNSAANRLNGAGGIDAMSGGAGDDVYAVDNTGDTTEEVAGGGTDTVESSLTWTLATEVERLALTGTGNLNGTGNSLANTLTGNSGNNVLNGGVENDTMAGGAGNDTYVVDAAGDVITEAAASGTDLVQSSVSYTLSADVENLTLTGTAAINGTGNALANNLTGNSADNVLNGGGGADTMVGGTGNDTYVIDSAGDRVTEAASGGTDTVESSVTLTLTAEVENLTLTGASAINATGNGLANTLRGNAANNTLNGGVGNDTMLGGLGDDTYVVDVAGDVVTENASEGTDLVQTGLTYTLGANVENLTLTGTTALNGTGNTLNNSMLGNSAANQLTGGSGDDLLNGAGGADTLVGGAGNDSYVVDNTADVVTEVAGEGADTLQSSATYTLQANVESLLLTGTGNINATGNADANTLTGNAGNNVLNGAAGADTMAGGAGNDSYAVDNAGDLVTELAGAGADTVNAGLTWALSANVENLTLTGTAAINGTGNDLANTLTGNSANNLLTGGAGDDVINGGTGNDTMLGGLGNDSYTVNVSTDVVTEIAGEGTDTVNSSVTLALGNNVENLTLTGTAAINGTGNTLDNTLTGNSGANVLQGLAANDSYVGGAGNDTLTDNATTSNDVYVWGTGQGSDTLTDAGGTDRIEMLAGVASSQVTLTRATNDLRIGITGSTDTLLIKNWYTGTANRIEEIRFADGSTMALGGAAPLAKTSQVTRSGVNGIKLLGDDAAPVLPDVQAAVSAVAGRAGLMQIWSVARSLLQPESIVQEAPTALTLDNNLMALHSDVMLNVGKRQNGARSGMHGDKLLAQQQALEELALADTTPAAQFTEWPAAWAESITPPPQTHDVQHYAHQLVQAMAGFAGHGAVGDGPSHDAFKHPRAGLDVMMGVPMA